MAVIGRLSRTALAVESRLAITFAQHGLDASSFDVLATLLRNGTPYRLPPGQLAQEAMVTTSAVAQRVNKLEARGLVRRNRNPDDGRGTLVELTATGKDLVEKTLPDHLETERALTASLTPEEQALLAQMLERLTVAAQA
jgi:DNA-binding MarR family transcriptional regulator